MTGKRTNDSRPTSTEDDAAARLRALDTGRSFIVQAPAGSGKTELLIQRYLALLAIVDSPEEVLAITFTVKAAAEMRERVVAALQRAEAGETSLLAHEQQTLASAEAVLRRDRARDWTLMEQPGRLRIQTLDAFSSSTTRALPVTAGLGGVANPVQGERATVLHRKAALATLDWLVGDEEEGVAVEQVLTHLDNNTDSYVAHLARMLGSRDQWLAITGSGTMPQAGSVRSMLEANVADVLRRHLARLKEQLTHHDTSEIPALVRYAANNLRDAGAADSAAATIPQGDELAGTEPDDLGYWQGLAELLLVKSDPDWRRRLTRLEGFPPKDAGQKNAWLDIIARLSEDRELARLLHGVRELPPARYRDDQWNILLALFRLLPLAVSELKRLFAEEGVTDHMEVSLCASAALGSADTPGEIALMLDHKIQHLLVDEMQDTSISQYEMLKTLTGGWQAGDGRTLFCVGDPMQSIYRFRHAEVGQFVMAREHGLGPLPLESLTLRRNFRSGEILVNWFNRVFAEIFPSQDDMSAGAVSYAESVSVDALAGSGQCELHPLLAADSREEAAETASIVSRILDETYDEDLAILVSSRTQLPELLRELRSRGVDYRAVDIDRITDLPEIIDLKALTRACCHPGDRAAWLALLRGPLVGLTWSDLHLLVRDSSSTPVWTLLADDARCRGLTHGARTLIAGFKTVMRECLDVSRSSTLRERIETGWYRLGGPAMLDTEQQLENAGHFLDLIEQLEVSGTLADPAELADWLDNERVSSRADDDCRVQVMTMYKSKGLQFDHVVLPTLGRYTRGSDSSVLSWLNTPGASGDSAMVISPVGPAAELEKDPLHQYIESARKASERLEKDRLLYVACTRAKKSLHLVARVDLDPKTGDVKAPHKHSLLNHLWPALESRFNAAAKRSSPGSAGAGTAADEGGFVAPPRRPRTLAWSVPQPPALPGNSGAATEPAGDADHKVEYYWVGAAARHAGTVVHRWLHRLALERTLPSAVPPAELGAVSRVWARAAGVAEQDLDAVCQRVSQALAAVLDDEQGRWLLAGEGFAELPLTGVVNGQLRSVVIDRVLVDGDTHWIVDYKTSVHEGGDLDGFLQQESARYTPQLERYARIYRDYSGVQDVRAALYFPLMQTFKPVDVA